MPIKATLYEYGVSSFLQIFTSQNDYKTTKLYYSTQPVLLPVKKHPKATCRKRAEYNLELAKYDFEMPANLEDSEIAAILPKVDELVSWVNDIKEYALQQALSGTVYDGYKVVEGRWSYANVWDPKAIDGGKPKYSVSLIIPKDDTATIDKIKAAIQAAYEEGQSKLKGNGKSVPPLSTIKNPLRDGDIEKPDDEAYAGCYFVNANSSSYTCMCGSFFPWFPSQQFPLF